MIIEISVLILLMQYKFDAILSASVTTEAVLKRQITTEEPGDMPMPHQIVTDGPLLKKNTSVSTDHKQLDDIEIVLKDIFKLTTSAPKTAADEVDSIEIKGNETDVAVSLASRTNFVGRPNCRCVVRRHCAKHNSCLKPSHKK